MKPLNYEARYRVALGGVTIGRIIIRSQEDGFTYNMLVDTKAKGVARWFDSTVSVSKTAGSIVDGHYVASSYTSDADKDGSDKDRHVKLTYTEGKLTDRVRTPDDDPKWRPPVPRDQANEAVDPLTGYFMLRQMVHDNMKANIRDAVVKTYDGARLTEMKLHVASKARVEVEDKRYDAINMVFSRKPLNGYTPKELKKINKDGDPIMHVYFSADERFIPLKLSISLYFGDITAELDQLKPLK